MFCGYGGPDHSGDTLAMSRYDSRRSSSGRGLLVALRPRPLSSRPRPSSTNYPNGTSTSPRASLRRGSFADFREGRIRQTLKTYAG